MQCVECSADFCTYIPGTDCLLPDGTIQCHQEPQDSRPSCSGGYGIHLNQDLFPEIAKYYKWYT